MKYQNRSEVSSQRNQTKELRTQQAKINGLSSILKLQELEEKYWFRLSNRIRS